MSYERDQPFGEPPVPLIEAMLPDGSPNPELLQRWLDVLRADHIAANIAFVDAVRGFGDWTILAEYKSERAPHRIRLETWRLGEGGGLTRFTVEPLQDETSDEPDRELTEPTDEVGYIINAETVLRRVMLSAPDVEVHSFSPDLVAAILRDHPDILEAELLQALGGLADYESGRDQFELFEKYIARFFPDGNGFAGNVDTRSTWFAYDTAVRRAIIPLKNLDRLSIGESGKIIDEAEERKRMAVADRETGYFDLSRRYHEGEYGVREDFRDAMLEFHMRAFDTSVRVEWDEETWTHFRQILDGVVERAGRVRDQFVLCTCVLLDPTMVASLDRVRDALSEIEPIKPVNGSA